MDRPGWMVVRMIVTMMMIASMLIAVHVVMIMLVIGVAMLIDDIWMRIGREIAADEESETQPGHQ